MRLIPLKTLLLAILSFILTLCLTFCLTIPTARSRSVFAEESLPPKLLQQGLALYQADRLTESIPLYQQAIAQYAQQQETLSEALAQRYLALAYQELGQWTQAKKAIDRSLKLLKISPSQNPIYYDVLAKVLNTQGRYQFQTGQLNAALETWKQATINYQKSGQGAGLISSLTNQAIAQQSLGFSIQAQTTLAAVYQALQNPVNTALKAEGLSHLGASLRRLGSIEQSRKILQESLNASLTASLTAISNPNIQSNILLELGNTEWARASRSLTIGKPESTQQVQTAIDYYQKSIETTALSPLKLKAQLNIFNLLVETQQNELARQRWQTIQPLLKDLSPNRANLYNQLNAVQTLLRLKQNGLRNSLPLPDTSEIAQLITTTYHQAQTLQDPRTESYALGQLGELYESNQQWPEAQKLTLQALLRIEELQVPDMRYRWEWQLARLLKQKGDRPAAINAYSRAITDLKSVRQNLLLINPDVQFSFRDRVEPIYRNLTDLLLSTSTGEIPQAQLQSAISNIDALQLAELENFLRCDLSQMASLGQNLDRLDAHAAFIYPIILADRIEVIVRLPKQPLKHYTTKIHKATVEKTLNELRRGILRSNASNVIDRAKQVYSWLIAPWESDLTPSTDLTPSIETLVFVLDGNLRNIPMGVLYDGKTNQYLVEKPYAIALLPNSQLFDLQTPSQPGKILGAGISEPMQVGNRRFNALNATAELAQINAKNEILLNSDFTHLKLQEKLRSQAFSTVHLVTHGQFSSDPEETYLLLYSAESRQKSQGELLKPNDFNNLLDSLMARLDLLVLSACETAESDKRATLGLVGLAIRSGARSTIGTLWQVNDQSTIALMNQFYTELKQPNISKAKALHRAQLSLLQTQKYQNPYHWAPYILVGNWQ
jgi:CHAT domain-containing protein